MHLLAPSILQKLKILRTDPELQPKIGQFVLNKLFLVQTIIITFIFLLVLLIVQNFKNFLLRIQSYEDVPFLGPKWSTCHKQFFFLKIINVILIYLLALSLCKILPKDPDLWGYAILGPKWHISPNEIFFPQEPVNEPCFFHSCLFTFYIPKIKVRY